MKKNKILLSCIAGLFLLSFNSRTIDFSLLKEDKQEPCSIDSMCYHIMQSEDVDNWQAHFGKGKTLSKDLVDLCLIDSLFVEFSKNYNKNIIKRNKLYDIKDNEIIHKEINIKSYLIQIVPYSHGNNIELLLSCLEKSRVLDIDEWKKNYFGMIHERGISHFYLRIDQTTKKIISFKS